MKWFLGRTQRHVSDRLSSGFSSLRARKRNVVVPSTRASTLYLATCGHDIRGLLETAAGFVGSGFQPARQPAGNRLPASRVWHGLLVGREGGRNTACKQAVPHGSSFWVAYFLRAAYIHRRSRIDSLH